MQTYDSIFTSPFFSPFLVYCLVFVASLFAFKIKIKCLFLDFFCLFCFVSDFLGVVFCLILFGCILFLSFFLFSFLRDVPFFSFLFILGGRGVGGGRDLSLSFSTLSCMKFSTVFLYLFFTF